MITAVLIVLVLILAVGRLKWKISAHALAYYIEKNQYKTPDPDDMKECTDFVGKQMFKDLVGH